MLIYGYGLIKRYPVEGWAALKLSFEDGIIKADIYSVNTE